MQDESKRDEEKIEQMLQSLRPISKESHQSDETRTSASKNWWKDIEEVFSVSDDEPKSAEAGKFAIDWNSLRERALRSPRLPKLDPLPTNILIAAEFYPGWTPDLSSWNLTIDCEGNLHQHIRADTPKAETTWTYQEEHLNIGADEVARLLKMAEEFGFSSFQKVTESITTDVASARLSFRLDGQIITHIEDGIGKMTEENTNRFYRLWKEVRRHAPFPQR